MQFLFTSWPYLNGGTSCSPGGGNGTWNGCTTNGTTPGGGISYTVFNNATTPASTTSQGRFNLNGDPANEYPLHSQDGNDRLTPGPTITAPSYFMFQQLSDPNPLNCIPPTAASSTYASTIFSFAYQATPSTQNVLSSGGQGLWSSCATGTWQVHLNQHHMHLRVVALPIPPPPITLHACLTPLFLHALGCVAGGSL